MRLLYLKFVLLFLFLFTYNCDVTGQNLILNGDCEEALVDGKIPHWLEVTGNNWTQRGAGPEPQSGMHYFFAGVASTAELSQQIAVSAYRCRIDSLQQTFRFSGYTRSFDQSPADESLVIIEFVDSGSTVLSAVTLGAFSNRISWQLSDTVMLAPIGSRKINIRLLSTRKSGSNNDGYYDNLALIPFPSGICPAPVAMFTASDSTYCGTPFNAAFTDLSTNESTSWIWYFEGAEPDSSFDQHPTGIAYNQPGSYDVSLICCNDLGCDTLFAADFIHVFELPEAPVISVRSDSLFVAAQGTVAWYELQQPEEVISTDTFFVPSGAGKFYVIITDQNGCASQSDSFDYTPSSIDYITSQFGLSIFPNPVMESLNIHLQNPRNIIYRAEIMDATGSLIPALYKLNHPTWMELNTNGLSPGVYLIRVYSGSVYMVKRFVKF